MTRDEFVAGLERIGAVRRIPQPGDQTVAVLEPQPVPGAGRRSRVAFLLPPIVTGRPTTYVDADLHLRSGGHPNNWRTTLVGTEVFGSWSFSCPWSPDRDAPEALVFAVLAQWNR